jgi:cysteine desulfurase/selenocysteine lyase
MSVAEHHSNLAPWQLVARRTGAVIKDCRLTPDTQELDLEASAV